MISRDEFDVLPAAEKVHIVFEYGETMDQREYAEFRMKLYLIGDFYAELWINSDNHQIGNLISLSPDEVLDLYGDYIDISDVYLA
jgi:hypothetical protein